jgi:hypothetical protein
MGIRKSFDIMFFGSRQCCGFERAYAHDQIVNLTVNSQQSIAGQLCFIVRSKRTSDYPQININGG